MTSLNSVVVRCWCAHFMFVSLVCSGTTLGVPCGKFRCAMNASCVTGECTCKAGTVGHGRFLCTRAGIDCGCIGFGLPDPRTKTFDGISIRATLQCTYLLARFTTQTGCDVQVDTATRARKEPMFPFRVLNDLVTVKVTRDNSVAVFTFGTSGVAGITTRVVPGLPDRFPNPDITVTTDRFNGFYRAVLNSCGTVLAFDPDLATMTVTTAASSTWTKAGFCGSCNSNPRNDNRFVSAHGVAQPEADFALSLGALAVVQSTVDAIPCKAIERQVQATSCKNDARLLRALKCCSILYDSSYANCVMVNKPAMSDYMLSVFVSCLASHCAGRISVAATFSRAFVAHGCVVPMGYTCV